MDTHLLPRRPILDHASLGQISLVLQGGGALGAYQAGVYQALDESQAGVWNQETRSWQPLDSSYRTAIRNGLRIARKQAAPDLIRLPLPAAHEAKESS